MDLLELVTAYKFKVVDQPIDKLDQKLEKVQHRLEFLGAAEVVRGIFDLVERFSGLGEQLQAAAVSAGLSVEELQKLQYAGSMAAVSSEDMDTALTHLTRTLYDAKKGGAEAVKTFDDVGISREQLAGFRTGKDALAAMADRFSRIQDPIKKQALAQEMLGRGSGKMVAFLSKGSKAIDEMGREAEKVGAVLSGPQVQALADVEDSLSQLWQVFRTFIAGVAAQFAPAIQKAVGHLLELYRANQAFIQQNLSKWAYNATYAFGYVFGIVEGLTIKFARFAREHETLVNWGGKLVLALVGLSMGANLLTGTLNLAQGALAFILTPFQLFWGLGGLVRNMLSALALRLAILFETALPALSEAFLALGASIEATPIGWILTALVGLTLAVQALWTVLHGGNFSDTWLGKLFSAGKGALGWVMDKVGLGGSGKATTPGAGAITPSGAALAGAYDNLDQLQRQAGGAGMAQNPNQLLPPPGAATGNYEINAPMTFNVPPGTDPKQVGQAAKEGVKEHLDRVSREMRRSLKPAQAY